MMRLDGQRPTAREMWTAFYRLWRIAHGHGAEQDIAAGWCFRVLFPDWKFIFLIDHNDTDGLTNRSHIPTFLRKQLLANHRKQRLYGGGNYDWIERDKATANKIREKEGIEVTPLEVAEVRWKLMQKAKAAAAECGVPAPRDYDELFAMLKGGKK